MALKFRQKSEQVRMIFADGEHLSTVDSVQSNPGKVFAVIGPFEGHMDKADLQKMLQTLCRGYNVVSEG